MVEDQSAQDIFEDVEVTEKGKSALNNVAMLVNFTATALGSQKRDQVATDRANQSFGVDEDAGYYSKAKINKHYLAPINSIINEARKKHRKLTLSWDNDRLLPNKNFMEYTQAIADSKRQLAQAAVDLQVIWPDVITEAQTRLGPLFDPAEYPPQDEVASLFDIETDIKPIPTSEGFGMNELIDTEKNLLKAKLAKLTKEREEKAKQESWYILYDVVAAMSKKLADTNAKRYHKTLISNIEDVLERLPALNVTNDPNLTAMMEQVRSSLCDYDPSNFGKDEVLKKQAATEADELLERMRTYMHGNN
jgi:hypothetical protein